MSYFYDEDTINEVREKNNIVDTVSKYVSLKRLGDNYKGLCPFHSEKTPSFTVSEEKQIFHCFGCGEGGDIITFLMKHENLEFIEALKVLADNANITLKKRNVNAEVDKAKNLLYEINREAGIYFYRNLFKNRPAYEYLINRGIDKDTVKTFGMGYASDGWNNLIDYLKEKKYSEKDMESAGLITHHKKSGRYFDKFRDRIMFPIFDLRGRIIGFGGRSIDNANQPKYLNSPETPVFSKGNNLYALNVVRKQKRSDDIVLVEGYMDVISLYKYGITNSVASLGTALTPNQVQLLKNNSKEIYICYDSDNAGMNATNKAIETMRKMNVKPKIIVLPENLDPDDFMRLHGLDEFNKLIENSLTSIDFKIQQKKKIYNLEKYQDKIDFLKDVAILLREIESPVELEIYIDKVSRETNIPSGAIKQEVNKNFVQKNIVQKDKSKWNKYKDYSKDNIAPVQYMLKPAHLTAEKELLNIILKNKEIYETIKDIFKPQDFLDQVHRKLAELIYRLYESNEQISLENISNHFDKDEKAKVKELFVLNLQANKDTKAIEDYINNINYYKITLRKEEIKEQIKIIDSKSEKTNDEIDLLNNLCLELMEIDKSLKINQ